MIRRGLVLAGLLVLAGWLLHRRPAPDRVPSEDDVAPDGTTSERYAG